MRAWFATIASTVCRLAKFPAAFAIMLILGAPALFAQSEEAAGGEASLKLPDLSSVSFLNNSIDGHKLLLIGILFCIF